MRRLLYFFSIVGGIALLIWFLFYEKDLERECACPDWRTSVCDTIFLQDARIRFNDKEVAFFDSYSGIAGALGLPELTVKTNKKIGPDGQTDYLCYGPNGNYFQYERQGDSLLIRRLEFVNAFAPKLHLPEHKITLSGETRLSDLEDIFPVSFRCLNCVPARYAHGGVNQEEKIKMKFVSNEPRDSSAYLILTFKNRNLAAMRYINKAREERN